MKRHLTRLGCVLISNIFLLSQVYAVSDPRTNLNFSVDRSDVSLQVLEQVFGLVDGILYGTGTQVLGKMFGVFNAAVLALGGIFLTYTLLVSTINTAQDGEVMGKKWSSVWIPVRVTFGVGLLVPKASGYCMMQIFILWIVVQGIGAANQVWHAALTYLEEGGVLAAKPLVALKKEDKDFSSEFLTKPAGSGSRSAVDISKGILNSLICMNALERSLEKWREDIARGDGTEIPPLVPSFSASVNLNNFSSNVVKVPSLPKDDPYSKFNGSCGQITLSDFSDLARKAANNIVGGVAAENKIERIKIAARLASQQLVDELNRIAIIIVDRNEEQIGYYNEYYKSKQQLASDNRSDLEIGDNITSIGQGTHPKGGWQSANFDSANASTLTTGYELKTAVMSYYALILPYLNSGSDADFSKKISFIPEARQKGWMMAGSYFFDMARLNMDLNELRDPASYFKLSSDTIDTTNNYFNRSNKFQEYDRFGQEIAGSRIGGIYPLSDYLRTSFSTDGKVLSGVGAYWRIQSVSDLASPHAYDDPLPDFLKGQADRILPASIYSEKTPNIDIFSGLIPLIPHMSPFNPRCSGNWIQKPVCKAMMVIIVFIFNDFIIFLVNMVIDILNIMVAAVNGVMEAVVIGPFLGIYNNIFSNLVNLEQHPILSLSRTGDDMIGHALGSFYGVMFVVLMVYMSPFRNAAEGILKLLKPILMIIFIFCTMYGYMFAYYIPFYPYMVFAFASLGWLIAVIEATVAAPIVALGLTHPEGQNEVFGKAEQAIMIIINIFLRPSLMIIGYIIGIVLSYAFVGFLGYSFNYANTSFMHSLSNSYFSASNVATGGIAQGVGEVGEAVSTAGGATVGGVNDVTNAIGTGRSFGEGSAGGAISDYRDNEQVSVGNLSAADAAKIFIAPIFVLTVFIGMYLEVVKKCFSLVYLLPDQILRWLSGGLQEQFGSQTAGQMEQAASQRFDRDQQQVSPDGKVAGKAAEKGGTAIGKSASMSLRGR